jgi:hypothetical protein
MELAAWRGGHSASVGKFFNPTDWFETYIYFIFKILVRSRMMNLNLVLVGCSLATIGLEIKELVSVCNIHLYLASKQVAILETADQHVWQNMVSHM